LMQRAFLPAIAALTIASGISLWWFTRPAEAPNSVDIAPGALWAATFRDPAGSSHSLGQFQGKVVVVNFWATWCVPCRDEMPAFNRLYERWNARGVTFLGLADDDPAKVERFGRELSIAYPLWVGGEAVGDLSRRLGNRLGVLPHTVIIDPSGRVLDVKVGPYTEADLEAKLTVIVAK
jgi:thiol-disulfide isomerase/thioredoxin